MNQIIECLNGPLSDGSLSADYSVGRRLDFHPWELYDMPAHLSPSLADTCPTPFIPVNQLSAHAALEEAAAAIASEDAVVFSGAGVTANDTRQTERLSFTQGQMTHEVWTRR